MATELEEMRVRAADLTRQINEREASFNEDNLPTEDDERELEAMYSARGELRAKIDRFGRITDRRSANGGRAAGAPPSPVVPSAETLMARKKTVGQMFIENPPYAEWLESVKGAGDVIPTTTRINQTPGLRLKGLAELPRPSMNAALLTGTSDTSGGAFIVNDRYPTITEYGRRPLTILDVITVLTTDSDAVDFARITGETINASVVAEATASGGSSGVKPESELAAEKVTTLVRTIAHWMAATKRVMSDLPQLRGLIDNFLRYGLDLTLENEIVTGSGSGEHFTGIEVTSGIQTQAWDTDILKTLRVARRKVLTVGRRRPTAYLLHPIDWETIDLLQDNEARYFFGGPMAMGTPRLWGLPVVESEAVTQGYGMVADWSVCVLWDREDTVISATDSHTDYFIRNLVAILAELRAAFGVLKPNAIVRADLTA